VEPEYVEGELVEQLDRFECHGLALDYLVLADQEVGRLRSTVSQVNVHQ
jgi:hypothetical protein